MTDSISSWAELEARIAALPSEQERGEAFEQFCKAFFILDPVFQFQKVYRQNEIPQSLRQKLGYPGIQDIGIDGLAVTIDGKLFAYQAKFRSDRSNIPTLRELSTFFTVSDRADWRITITNANSLPAAINDRTNQSRILVDRFDQLDSDFFNRLRLYLEEQRIEPQKKKTPHQTQQEAIESALSYFQENSRGQLILPCGTGKTLVAMWIAEKLGGNRILIMVPSLSLMSQTLREWAANTSLKPFRYLCLCSDTTVDLGKDSPVEHLYEMDVPVTTDAEVISEFLKNEPAITSILLSTYQSSKVLSEAVKKTGIGFDAAIFDEAHRTTGSDVGVWNLAIDDKNVPIKKRIFMTATPRIYAPHISKKAKEKDILLYSMDDNEIYGKPFYEMTFGQAIEKDLITDYKVVIICVTDREIKELIQSGGRVVTDDNHEWDAKAFAKQVALVKALDAYKLKKVFTFHSRVPSAKAFTQTDSPYSIKQVIKMLNPPHPNPLPQGARESAPPLRGGDEGEGDKINLFHVNGTMSSGFRNSIMKEFRESEIGIMSNARCLIEGVDVPAVDTVAFIDPKKSIIDIVQATGRALRKAEWKEKGYIFIPVVVDEDANPEDLLKSSDFDTVWEVLQAMMDQDQRLESIVSQLRTMQGEQKEGTQQWNDLMKEYVEKVEFYNIPEKIDQAYFTEKLYTKIIEATAKSWDFWYGLTLQHKEQNNGDPNVPLRQKTKAGFNLGSWQGNQRYLYRNKKLSSKKIRRLEEIGFIWDYHALAFEEGFQKTLRFKAQNNGNPNIKRGEIFEGFNLDIWQNNQRRAFKKNKLSHEQVRRLEDIGFIWDHYALAFEEGFQKTLRFKAQNNGDPNASWNGVFEGFNLANWQGKQRHSYKKNKLFPDRIKRLADIGFIWDHYALAFEEGFQKTLRFKAQNNGNPNAKWDEVFEGFNLGYWQSALRHSYKQNRLSPEKIRKLEKINFKWTISTVKKIQRNWDFWYELTLKYKEQLGNPNAPRKHITPDGFKLGSWQSELRKKYRQKKLSPEKIQRMEEIGFVWDRLALTFAEGFQKTLRFKEQNNGNPNAKWKEVFEGFNLGIWQTAIRQSYRKSQISPEKIRKLEKIGFKWRLSTVKKIPRSWDFWYELTLKYKEQFGNPNAPQRYVTPEGFNLGGWQSHQRKYYKSSKLAMDRIKRLANIGFLWDILEEAFEQGIRATLIYKEITGNANAPDSYKTPEGYNLGQWQAHQRRAFNKGKLEKKRIKMLEEIGFIWNRVSKNKASFDIVLDEGVEEGLSEESRQVVSDSKENVLNPTIFKNVAELELSARSSNCLKRANIKTIADLVQKTELDLLKRKNFGKKSLKEIKEILVNMGLHFGMNLDTENIRKDQASYRSTGEK